MTFIDLFAGVGGFRKGMELAGHKCIGFCEWDKYATASYTSMHLITEEQRERLAQMDIKKRQKEILDDEYRNGEWYSNDIRNVCAGSLPMADCWCFGAPCQDFSVAGKRRGLEGDRSSLVREVFRILQETREEDRPEWLIYENVKGMLNSNRGFDFLSILLAMDELGYDCEWEVFNTKNFGVPQNRERVYTIGHLRSRGGQKIFPLPATVGANYLERREKTNIIAAIDKGGTKQEGTAVVIPVLTPDRKEKRQNGRRFKENGEVAFTLTSQDRHGVGINIIGNSNPIGCGESGLIIDDRGVAPTVMENHGSVTKVVRIKEATRKGFAEAAVGDSINLSFPCSKTRRGRVGVGVGVAQTLDVSCCQAVISSIWSDKYQCYISVRRLTPKECFRLQGWSDEYFERAAFVNFNNQLYKQAGNGVTVDVVYEIAKHLNTKEERNATSGKP